MSTPTSPTGSQQSRSVALVDAHCHWCVFDRPGADITAELQRLAAEGHQAVAVYVMASLGLAPQKVPRLVPQYCWTLSGLDGGRRCLRDDLDSWLEFRSAAQEPGLEVVPFLDLRGWDGELDLRPLIREGGFRGLKDILLLDEDGESMQMEAIRHLWGFSREEYLARHRRTFALAAELGLPLAYHADLRHHDDFVHDCLRAHPELSVDVPHFGFSRRLMVRFFAEHPRLVTDIASLESHISVSKAAYAEFMAQFADRVLLGSDSLAGWDFAPARRYAALVHGLDLPAPAREAILHENARAFLGLAGPA